MQREKKRERVGLGAVGMPDDADAKERKEKSNNQKINNSMEPNIQSNDSWDRWSRSITQFASVLLALVNDSSATSHPISSSSSPSSSYVENIAVGLQRSLFPRNQPFFCIMLNPINPSSQHAYTTRIYLTKTRKLQKRQKGRRRRRTIHQSSKKKRKFGRPDKVDSFGGRKKKDS